ncbi:hypothetical protein [Paenibacillus agricola]|uniref:Uncharacterized protein n=1 Tax=Paenibacillus agricola TaxID=2716264 RepID=A0ABX0JH27_9BACL|nr:hypothetical protein [Paenibacillus agricola]NHN33146.1 hypothetical protein [Paenibacillus agricola]
MMLDPIIEFIQSQLNYKSDIPVILVFASIIFYGFMMYVPRVWLVMSTTIAILITLYYPIYFISPVFSKFLAGLGLIGEHWLIDENVVRNIGIGIFIGIILTSAFLYMFLATIWELNQRRNPIYMLKLKKEPSHKNYMMAKSLIVDQYSKTELAFFLDRLDMTDINFIQNNLAEETDIKTAMAWVYIGVPVRRAVTKVRIDLQYLNQAGA